MVNDEATGARVIADGGRFDLHLLRETAYQVLLEPVQFLGGQPGPVLTVQYVQVDRDFPYSLHRPGAALLARGRGRQPGGRQVLLLGRHQSGQPDGTAVADAVVVRGGVRGVHVALDAQEYQRSGERVRHQQRADERVPQTAFVALALGVRHPGPFDAVVVAVATETPLSVVHGDGDADHRGRRRQLVAVVRRRVTAYCRTGHAVVAVHGRCGRRLLRTAR